jgi:hypothetical protein
MEKQVNAPRLSAKKMVLTPGRCVLNISTCFFSWELICQ